METNNKPIGYLEGQVVLQVRRGTIMTNEHGQPIVLLMKHEHDTWTFLNIDKLIKYLEAEKARLIDDYAKANNLVRT